MKSKTENFLKKLYEKETVV